MTEESATAADYLHLMAAAVRAHGLEPSTLVQPADRYVQLNGVKFHYLDWGNDHLPPVILLHGGGLNAHTWDMGALLLRHRYHLIALDQRGSGDTGPTPEGVENGWDAMVDDLHALLDHLGYGRVVLCGMSMGGMNALFATARDPRRVGALVVVDYGPDSAGRPPGPEGNSIMRRLRARSELVERFEDQLKREIQDSPRSHPDHLRYSLWHSLRERLDGRWEWKGDRRSGARARQDPEAWVRRRDQLWEAVRAIDVPTLLMRGESSQVVTPEGAESMVAAMTNARLVVVPNAGHNVQTNNPRAFAAELEAFVSAHF